jgi:hypothetical protein
MSDDDLRILEEIGVLQEARKEIESTPEREAMFAWYEEAMFKATRRPAGTLQNLRRWISCLRAIECRPQRVSSRYGYVKNRCLSGVDGATPFERVASSLLFAFTGRSGGGSLAQSGGNASPDVLKGTAGIGWIAQKGFQRATSFRLANSHARKEH